MQRTDPTKEATEINKGGIWCLRYRFWRSQDCGTRLKNQEMMRIVRKKVVSCAIESSVEFRSEVF